MLRAMTQSAPPQWPPPTPPEPGVVEAPAPAQPAPRPSTLHVTQHTGQSCDGAICVICTACASCSRKVGTPHVDICECPPTRGHYVCEVCERDLDQAAVL